MLTWITRPYRQGASMEGELRRRGYRPLFLPLLKVSALEQARSSLDQYSCIVVTSANAVPPLVPCASLDTPVFAVGPDTAAAARNAGFKFVHAAEGTAESLIRMIPGRWPTEQGPIVYASGSDITRDIAAELTIRGYEARRVVVYTTSPLTELSADLLSSLHDGGLHSVVLMSTRTAEILGGIIRRHGLEGSLSSVVAFVISRKVAVAIRDLPWKDVRIAPHPTRTGMLSLMTQPA